MPDFLIDDRGIIPEEILKMTKAERRAEIARLEKEASRNKSDILKMRTMSKVV